MNQSFFPHTGKRGIKMRYRAHYIIQHSHNSVPAASIIGISVGGEPLQCRMAQRFQELKKDGSYCCSVIIGHRVTKHLNHSLNSNFKIYSNMTLRAKYRLHLSPVLCITLMILHVLYVHTYVCMSVLAFRIRRAKQKHLLWDKSQWGCCRPALQVLDENWSDL